MKKKYRSKYGCEGDEELHACHSWNDRPGKQHYCIGYGTSNFELTIAGDIGRHANTILTGNISHSSGEPFFNEDSFLFEDSFSKDTCPKKGQTPTPASSFAPHFPALFLLLTNNIIQ